MRRMGYAKAAVDLRKSSIKLSNTMRRREIFPCYKSPVNKVNFFAQLFSGVVSEIIALSVMCSSSWRHLVITNASIVLILEYVCCLVFP